MFDWFQIIRTSDNTWIVDASWGFSARSVARRPGWRNRSTWGRTSTAVAPGYQHYPREYHPGRSPSLEEGPCTIKENCSFWNLQRRPEANFEKRIMLNFSITCSKNTSLFFYFLRSKIGDKSETLVWWLPGWFTPAGWDGERCQEWNDFVFGNSLQETRRTSERLQTSSQGWQERSDQDDPLVRPRHVSYYQLTTDRLTESIKISYNKCGCYITIIQFICHHLDLNQSSRVYGNLGKGTYDL